MVFSNQVFYILFFQVKGSSLFFSNQGAKFIFYFVPFKGFRCCFVPIKGFRFYFSNPGVYILFFSNQRGYVFSQSRGLWFVPIKGFMVCSNQGVDVFFQSRGLDLKKKSN